MAPELWRGEKASKASDIFALGVVLYEMVAGRPPFADEADRRTGRPPPAATLAKDLGTRWDRTILECLRAAPEDRPADAALVLTALKKKPMRKAPFLALILVVSASMAAPQVRGWLRDGIWPPPEVRLALFLPKDQQTLLRWLVAQAGCIGSRRTFAQRTASSRCDLPVRGVK